MIIFGERPPPRRKSASLGAEIRFFRGKESARISRSVDRNGSLATSGPLTKVAAARLENICGYSFATTMGPKEEDATRGRFCRSQIAYGRRLFRRAAGRWRTGDESGCE